MHHGDSENRSFDAPLLIAPWMLGTGMLGTGTVLVEYLLAIGLWIPKIRWFVALTGILFHLSSAMVMKIFMLDWVSMFLYLAFLPPFEKKSHAGSGPMMMTTQVRDPAVTVMTGPQDPEP